MEKLIIEEIKELNEFEILVLDFLDLFNDSDQFEPIVSNELKEKSSPNHVIIPPHPTKEELNFRFGYMREIIDLIAEQIPSTEQMVPDNDLQNNERQINMKDKSIINQLKIILVKKLLKL